MFLFGAIGIIDIKISENPLINISSQLLEQPENFSLSFEKIITTKEFSFLLISGLTLSFALPLLAPLKALVLTLILLSFTIVIAFISPNVSLIPIEYCFLTILIIYVVHVLMSYVIELHSKQKLIDSFGQYIPPHLVNELSKSPKELSLEGESRTLSVFFCDLQGFTSISEQLNPKQLNKLLNEYFTVMSEIIFKHGGTIDKYIGDAIMAFWNAPTKQE
ncbi:MAG: adenylate/guanylate cyclase domain-containing protein, partial [Gammaproteobacteria bacterium]